MISRRSQMGRSKMIYKRRGLTQGTNLLGEGVQSTHPMASMLELGGLGACPPPPRKILKNRS